MPDRDLHDLLTDAAGTPPPLDLDAVRARGRAYQRNRRLLVAAGAGTTAALAVVLAAVVTSSPSVTLGPDMPASPGPTSPPPAVEADGIVYGDITAVRGLQVTYDKVDYLKAACDARTKPEDFVQTDRAHAICFRNTNPRLRTLPLSLSAPITWVPESDAAYRITAAQLPRYVDNGLIWKIRVEHGVIVQLELFPVASA